MSSREAIEPTLELPRKLRGFHYEQNTREEALDSWAEVVARSILFLSAIILEVKFEISTLLALTNRMRVLLRA